MRVKRYCCTCIFVLFFPFCAGHDLCINGYPPDDHSAAKFKLCEKYKGHGCCGETAEKAVVKEYKGIISSENIGEGCRNLIAAVLCQKCSPRSAHLYQAFDKVGKYPTLCEEFCSELQRECGTDAIDRIFDEKICRHHGNDVICYPETENPHEHRGKKSSDETTDCIPVCLEKVADGVKNIVDGAFPPDGSNRLFLVQQDGLIWELDAQRKEIPTPFLDIRRKVQNSKGTDERGLLSMVFHPDFNRNNMIFLFYNPSDAHSVRSRIVRMKVSDAGTPMTVDQDSEEVLLEYGKPQSNHNGGQLMFGNDGYLYVTVGDGGGANDRHGKHGNGQSLTTFLGKILRIDVNAETGYKIPNDNPFAHETGEIRKEIFAYGLRNPWRMSIDRQTGTIFAGDVGQQRFEEVDIIVGGGNYGWRLFEGKHCFDHQMCQGAKVVEPIYSYAHDEGTSVIGGYVYRGSKISMLEGKYVFGDLDKSSLWALESHGDTWKRRSICVGKEACSQGKVSKNPRGKLLGFTEDSKGEIYAFIADSTWMSIADGAVYKLAAP